MASIQYISNGVTCCIPVTDTQTTHPALAYYDSNGCQKFVALTTASLSGHPHLINNGTDYSVGVAPEVGGLRFYSDHIEVCCSYPFALTIKSCAYSSTCGSAADNLSISIPANCTGSFCWDNFTNDAVYAQAIEDAYNGCSGAYSGYYFTTTGGNLCWDGTCTWCAHCNSIWCCAETEYESYDIGYTGLRCFCAGLWAYNILTGWHASVNSWQLLCSYCMGTGGLYSCSNAVWDCCTECFPGSGEDPDIYCTHTWTCELKRVDDNAEVQDGKFSIVGQWPQYHSASVTVYCVSWNTCSTSGTTATIMSTYLPQTFTGLTTNARNVVNVGLRYDKYIACGSVCCENYTPDTNCIDWRYQNYNFTSGCDGGFLTYGICSSIGGNGTVNTWDNCLYVCSDVSMNMQQCAHNCLVVFPAYREISGVSCAHSL